MKKYLLLSVLVIAFFALSLGTANAVWKIGGSGPFLAYPFYVEGAFDAASFKTYLVVNNTDPAINVNIAAAVHFVTSDNDGDTVISVEDLKYDTVDSEFKIHSFPLTPRESQLLTVGTTAPLGLGSEVLVWTDPVYTVGWIEMWAYDSTVAPPFPVMCYHTVQDRFYQGIRGEGITIDLAHSSAWSYKAVASVTDPNGNTSSVDSAACNGIAGGDDVAWMSNWHGTWQIPVKYDFLASAYNVDLWVRSPGDPPATPDNNTNIILVNPNHRMLSGSPNICRDCTQVGLDLFNAAEEDRHPPYALCEMRIISIVEEPLLNGFLHGPVFYGWGELHEFDNNIHDSAAGAGCPPAPLGHYHNAICGPLDPLLPVDPTCNGGAFPWGNCRACDLDQDGFLAVAFTSWRGIGIAGLTYWGNNLFNNCGDAAGWNDYAGNVPACLGDGAGLAADPD